MRAHEILQAGAKHLEDRAKTYDKPGGERSMEKIVKMFNTLADTNITVEQGWQFMTLLKMVRSQQGAFKGDNYEDGCSYFALAGEEAESERVQPGMPDGPCLVEEHPCPFPKEPLINTHEFRGQQISSDDVHKVMVKMRLDKPPIRNILGVPCPRTEQEMVCLDKYCQDTYAMSYADCLKAAQKDVDHRVLKGTES